MAQNLIIRTGFFDTPLRGVMRRYKLVVFDFDGTLADTFQWFKTALNEAALKYHFKPIREDDVEKLRHYGVRELITYMEISWWKRPLIARYMRRRMREGLQKLHLFEGAQKMLGDLSHSGLDLAIVSSNALGNIQYLLGPETSAKITHFETGVSLFGKKNRFQKLLRLKKLRPEEAIYIGDETRDHEAARAVGMSFGAVVWGYAGPELLKKGAPDIVFEKMSDITSMLTVELK
jgi:phosphoglycolate phosphatase